MRATTLCLLALAGCRCGDDDDTQAPDPQDSLVETDAPADPPHECTEPAPLPVEAETLSGFLQAEDFVLDGDGYLVGIDYGGNLVGINQQGERKVILPGAGEWTSGMHQLLDGSFVYSDAMVGALMKVTPGGGAEALVSGMSYPNGIEVDPEGFVYVTEHDAGRVRRIDPTTGEYSFVAQGLYHPNGIQFSPDYGTLYVNSFGGGHVHAIHRTADETWEPPVLLGYVPSIDPESIPTPCAEAREGGACLMVYGGIGACTASDGAELDCTVDRDHTACDGLAHGDSCSTTALDDAVVSMCIDNGDLTDEAFCPRIETERVEPCDGKAPYSGCQVKGEGGYCVTGWEGVQVCLVDSDYAQLEASCEGLTEGDACSAWFPTGPWHGVCENYAHYGWGIACGPWYGWGEKGGLDGMAVDACENVYVSEYISGEIYRFSPEGDPPELVYSTGDSWIPNMHWGNGIGGWEEDTLYVLSRDNGDVHALAVDVMGVEEAYQPGVTDAR
jgi:sugar lactone lactonase YvrE